MGKEEMALADSAAFRRPLASNGLSITSVGCFGSQALHSAATALTNSGVRDARQIGSTAGRSLYEDL